MHPADSSQENAIGPELDPAAAAPISAAPATPSRASSRSAIDELRLALDGIPFVPAVACVVSMAVLVVSHYQGGTGFYRDVLSKHLRAFGQPDVDAYLYWFAASIALYGLLPLLACAFTPGIRVRETGTGLGDARFGFTATALLLATFLPVVALASHLPAFAGQYPMCSQARAKWSTFLAYEAAYALYFFGWEYLFRGYLLFSLEKNLGKFAAFAQMLPFVVAHLGKPEAETLGSIVAGVVLGLIALRARSFLYGALVHATVAVSMDVLAAWGTLPWK